MHQQKEITTSSKVPDTKIGKIGIIIVISALLFAGCNSINSTPNIVDDNKTKVINIDLNTSAWASEEKITEGDSFTIPSIIIHKADKNTTQVITFDGKIVKIGDKITPTVGNHTLLATITEGGGDKEVKKMSQLVIVIALDSDGDGVPDKTDAFPKDKTETVDSDADGVGDNADAFPDNPNKSKNIAFDTSFDLKDFNKSNPALSSNQSISDINYTTTKDGNLTIDINATGDYSFIVPTIYNTKGNGYQDVYTQYSYEANGTLIKTNIVSTGDSVFVRKDGKITIETLSTPIDSTDGHKPQKTSMTINTIRDSVTYFSGLVMNIDPVGGHFNSVVTGDVTSISFNYTYNGVLYNGNSYTDGNINNESTFPLGTIYTITKTDSFGNTFTHTGVINAQGTL